MTRDKFEDVGMALPKPEENQCTVDQNESGEICDVQTNGSSAKDGNGSDVTAQENEISMAAKEPDTLPGDKQTQQRISQSRRIDAPLSTSKKAALLYAKMGLPVIPLAGKIPHKDTHGYKDGTTDEQTIKKWWKRWPNSNVGIVTGKRSRIAVLDIDKKNDGYESLQELEEKHGGLPSTLVVNSGGGGRHYYFSYPDRGVPRKINVCPGIDVIPDSSYIVAPPSKHPVSSRRYEWDKAFDVNNPNAFRESLADMPDWLLDLIDKENVKSTSTNGQCTSTIQEGNRHNTLVSLAGKLRNKGLTEEDIFEALWKENADRCNPPLEDKELRSIAAGIVKYPVNEKSKDKPKPPDAKLSAYFKNLVDLALDDKGNVVFMILCDGKIEFRDKHTLPDGVLIPPRQSHIQWELPNAANVLKHYDTDNDQKLFEDLVTHLKTVSELPTEHHYSFLALWLMTTYLWDRVDYLPIIIFYAIAERGKTRTGRALIYAGWRGHHLVTVNEAHIIRLAHNFRATLFFDVTDIQKKMEKSGTEDIFLHRFEKGAKVMRVPKPELGPFEDTVYYEVYGPTIIATNQPVNPILDTRVIQIVMPETNRIFDNDIKVKDGLPYRERLLAFRARWLNKELPIVSKPAVGRLGDILRPLLQIMTAIRIDDKWFHKFIQQVEKDRREANSDTKEAKVLKAILEAKGKIKNGRLSNSDIQDYLDYDQPERFRMSPVTMGRILQRLGFERYNDGSERGIVWDEELIRKLCSRYGVEYDDTDNPEDDDDPMCVC